MNQIIGGCTLAKAQVEISAEDHQLETGPYVLTLTLPDTTVVVSAISAAELAGLGKLIEAVREGAGSRERWDGQSGG